MFTSREFSWNIHCRRKNEKAFTEIKNYYNDITLNNLAMISTLKEEIRAKDEKLERNEQMLGTVQVWFEQLPIESRGFIFDGFSI